MTLQSLSVCLPAFNDELTVGAVVRAAVDLLEHRRLDYEMIVVNDGSLDRTGDVLEALACEHPRLRIMHHPVNQGYGCAVRAALAAATKEFVFYTDSDGQFDVRDLGVLLDLAGTADVLNGYRVHRQDPWHRRMIGGAIALLGRRRFRVPLRDIGCDFRLFRRQWLERLTLQARDGTFGVELAIQLHRAGARFAEVPIRHAPRRHGRSQFFQWRRIVATTGELWQLLTAR